MQLGSPHALAEMSSVELSRISLQVLDEKFCSFSLLGNKEKHNSFRLVSMVQENNKQNALKPHKKVTPPYNNQSPRGHQNNFSSFDGSKFLYD